MSDENLLRMRPIGVTSKKAMGAPNVASRRNLCNFDDVPVISYAVNNYSVSVMIQ